MANGSADKGKFPMRLLVGAVVAALLLVACGGDEDPGATDGAATGDSAIESIGIVRFSGTDVFSNNANQGAADYAEEQGWDVVDVDAQGSVDQANAAIANLVTRGVDAIVVGVFPTDALAGGISQAESAGIPVANWGGGLGPGVQVAADVGLGDEVAARVVEDMNGEGELLLLGYRPGLPCQRRETSMMDALEGTDINPTQQQITIPGQVDSALAATQSWAQAHSAGSAPSLAAWACFDDPATGAVAALRELGRDDVLSYGNNGTAEALQLVMDGELTATQWIDGYGQGQELVRVLQQAIAEGESFEPTEIGGETVIVDESNIEEFLSEHPDALEQ